MSIHPHADALSPFDWLRTELDRLFENAAPAESESWTPPLTLHETESAFELRLPVAGADPEKIDVRVEDGVVHVAGERAGPPKDTARRSSAERITGPFRRALQLPSAVDVDGVAATYRDGILSLTLPRARETLPHRIPVAV